MQPLPPGLERLRMFLSVTPSRGSHRAHASVEAITHVVPVCAAGFLMKKEIKAFESADEQACRGLWQRSWAAPRFPVSLRCWKT